MLDSFGREIRYLRVSVTDRCNLRCAYCMPAEGVPSLPHERIISFERIAQVCEAAAGLGFDKVRLTGGEPLVRKGVEGLVSMIAAIEGIDTVAMTTNGTLLAPLASELKSRGLSSVNVSLDTLDEGRYAAITRGGRVADALAGISAALAAGLPVKLNAVVGADGILPEDAEAVREFARRSGCGFQSIRYYRLDERKRDDERFQRPPPCADCNRIRLLATGELKPCLQSDLLVPVDWSDVAGSIRACALAKPEHGYRASRHAVNEIGG